MKILTSLRTKLEASIEAPETSEIESDEAEIENEEFYDEDEKSEDEAVDDLEMVMQKLAEDLEDRVDDPEVKSRI